MDRAETALGVVGVGLLGLRHATIFDQMPGVRLAGVVDVDPEARTRVEKRFGVPSFSKLDDLLEHENVDGVSICLPDGLHFEVTRRTVEAGLHVLLEKPMTMDVTEGEHLTEIAENSKRVIMLGHMLRFDPRYDLARRAVRSGQIGSVNHLYARRNSAITGIRRYGSSVRLMWHVTVHDIDLIRFVTGREVSRVTAYASSKALRDIGQLDSLLALLKLDDGTPCVLESSWVLPPYFKEGLDAQLEIVGTDGVLEVTGLEQGLKMADAEGMRYPDTMRYVEMDDGHAFGILKNELEHFVRCILTDLEPLAGVRDGLAAVRVAAAIERSIQSDTSIKL